MALTTAQLSASVEPVVQKEFGLGIKDKGKRQFESIFKVSNPGATTDNYIRYAQEFGGPGIASLKTQNAQIASVTVNQGARKGTTADTYAMKMELSNELIEHTRLDEIKKAARILARAMHKTPEYITALMLDRAFNSAYPVTPDGKELCATDHAIPGGGTFSNEMATPAALSEDSLEDVLTALRTITGQDGLLDPISAKGLIVNASLNLTAQKLLKTTLQVGSANNTVSLVASGESGMKILPFDFLATNNRWMVTTDHSDGLWFEWLKKDQFMEESVPMQLAVVFIAVSRLRMGCDDPRGVYGVAAV